MKRLLLLCITAGLLLSACSFFTFENPADPRADNFTGVVIMDGVETIEKNSSGVLILAEGIVYRYDYSGECTAVSGLPSGITAVSGGYGSHSLALDSRGRVWAWGSNSYGQLGFDTGDMSSTDKPAVVKGVDVQATFIRSNTYKSAAGTAGGTTYIWGNFNTENIQLQYNVPTAMSWGIVKDIAIGSEELLILTADGKVFIWNAELPEPAAVTGLSDITAVSVSSVPNWTSSATHYLALDGSGRVWAWGSNNSGQLGDGTTVDRSSPSLVPGLAGVTAVAARARHSLALTDASLYGWGSTDSGSTGKIWNKKFLEPVAFGTNGKIGGESPLLFFAGISSTVVYTDSGYLYGIGGTSDCPVCGYLDGCMTDPAVFALENTAAAAVCSLGYASAWNGDRAENFSLMLMNDGRLYGFGDNASGQMGNGATGWISVPEDTGLSGFKSIAVGGGFVIAAETGGTVKAWGEGSTGQLGDGTGTDSLVPVNVTGLSGITSVAAGNQFSLACKDDGTVWGWGSSSYGQIGASNLSTAGQISGLSGITAVAAGANHSLALKNDGTVWALGLNSSGQLGNNTAVNSNTPVQAGITGVTAIAASNDISAALKNDGTVWAWGSSGANALSQGSAFIDSTATPFKIGGSTAVSIAAGAGNVLILHDDGSLFITGTAGELTKDANELYPGPYPLDSFAGLTIEKIYGGFYGFMIIDDAGNAFCWLQEPY